MPEFTDDPLRIAPLPAGTAGGPTAIVLMLHGGAEHGLQPVDSRSLSLRRTSAMFAAVAPRLAAAGVATSMLRFTVKGWNAGSGPEPSPVTDARAATTRLHAEYPGLPIVLLGHSMGARTAAWVADAPGVIGVVGLAPWLPKNDPVEALRGKHLIAAHGAKDKITSARHTRRFVERAGEVAASARFIDMGRLGHYMVRGAGRWNDVAVSASLDLVGAPCPKRDDVGGITSGN